MRRSTALKRLAPLAAALRALGATSLYLFGSTARNRATPLSDLDLFIDYSRRRPFSLVDLIRIKHLLEDRLDVPVDIATRNSLHPLLKSDIEKSAIRVF